MIEKFHLEAEVAPLVWHMFFNNKHKRLVYIMLNKNKKKEYSPLTISDSLSILSNAATIRGEINIDDDLRIDGNVSGNINSQGRVIVGLGGCVTGTIRSKSVELVGKIYGDIIVSEIAILRASSFCNGDLIAANLEIEAGASFCGNCKMENVPV